MYGIDIWKIILYVVFGGLAVAGGSVLIVIKFIKPLSAEKEKSKQDGIVRKYGEKLFSFLTKLLRMKKTAKRHRKYFVEDPLIICVGLNCKANLFRRVERRSSDSKREAVEAIYVMIEEEFACFNPDCPACKNEEIITGKYYANETEDMMVFSSKPQPFSIVRKAV